MVVDASSASRVLSYCGPALDPAAWASRWNLDPLLIGALALLVLAARHLARAGNRPDARRVGLAVAMLAFLYVSPFCALGSSLFTVRVVHHLALGLLVAPLLAPPLGRRLDRVPGGLGAWTVIATLEMWAWHAPRLYGWAVSNDAGYWLMQVTILGSAILFWRRLDTAGPLPAVVALLGAMVAMGALGALITFAAVPLYPAHFATTAAWGLAPLDDQQLAGLVMWAPASAIYLLAALMRVRTMALARGSGMIRAIRRWARRHSRRGRYTPVGIAFHWIMAALVIYQLLAGWAMERQPVGEARVLAYADHAATGLLILLLAILRFVWRAIVPGPINDADAPGWQADVARVTHVVFYLLFALLPLSGLLMWSAIQPAAPLMLGGLLPFPPVPLESLSTEWQMRVLEGAERAHGLGIIGLALLVPLHIGAALKHHFWDRHDVLEGMLPEIEDSRTHPQGAGHAPPPPRPDGRPIAG